MRGRLRRMRRQDAGFTIIELAIAASIMALIAVMVASTVIGGLRTSARGETRTDDAAGAQRAMLRITADLRAVGGVVTATATGGFLEANGTRVVAYTRSTGLATSSPADVPEKVTYALSSTGDLVLTRQSGTRSGSTWTATGAARTSTILKGVLQPAAAGRPLFRFLSVGDSQNQCLTGATAGTLGDPVVGTNLSLVYSVDVWLSVNSAPRLNPTPLVVQAGAVLASQGPLVLDTAHTSTLGFGQGC